MDLQGISTFVAARQAFTSDEARALVLRVGQEMTATLLEMVDGLALLDVGDGRKLAAKLQTDQPLTPGQTVQLEPVDVQPEQVIMRLVSSGPGPTDSQQPLASTSLPDMSANRAAFVALVSEGLPASTEAIQTLNRVAASLGAASAEDLQAVAYLLGHDLPLAPAFTAVVRQGQAANAEPGQLEGQLRTQASELLALIGQAPDEVGSSAAQLVSLLRQLGSELPAPGLPPDATALQAMLAQLTISIEAALLAGASDDGLTKDDFGVSEQAGEAESPNAPGSTSVSAGSAASGSVVGDAAPSAEPTPSSGADGDHPAPVAASTVASPVQDQEKAEVAGAPSGAPQLSNGADQQRALPQSMAGDPSQSRAGAGGVSGSHAPEPGVDWGENFSSEAPQQSSPELAPAISPPLPVAPEEPRSPSLALPLPALGHPMAGQAPAAPAAPSAHEIARRLIPALDRTIASGNVGPSITAGAAELRHTAERFVQAAQFQHLQTILQPTPAEPYVSFPLPIPVDHGEADLRLYVREEGGRARIDPDDLRLAIELRLSQLKRVSVLVHLYRRQLTCHIETDSLPTQRLMESAAPELRESLRQLGFAVDPIHCAIAGFFGRDATEVELPLAKLGGFNVTA